MNYTEELKQKIATCLEPLPFSGEAELPPVVKESMLARIMSAVEARTHLDAQRMDWLIANPRARYYGPHSGINPFPHTGHAHHLVEGFGNLTKSLGCGHDLRSAIDAAMSPAPISGAKKE